MPPRCNLNIRENGSGYQHAIALRLRSPRQADWLKFIVSSSKSKARQQCWRALMRKAKSGCCLAAAVADGYLSRLLL